MKIEINNKQSYPFDLTVDQLSDLTLYECNSSYIKGPILISTVNNGKITIRVANLFGSHNGLAYDPNTDAGLRNAKYRKFQGSVTLTE